MHAQTPKVMAVVQQHQRVRGVTQALIIVWATVAFSIALAGLKDIDSPPVVLIVASVVGPLAAVAAAMMLSHGADRSSGLLLLVSVGTPTYFAWFLNVPALVLSLMLLVWGKALLPPRPMSPDT